VALKAVRFLVAALKCITTSNFDVYFSLEKWRCQLAQRVEELGRRGRI
jgi:hypothetical protein